ncbi:MAG: hypothetical protein IPL16_11640 [Ignavibacteria bacterium]|nr:hypothetical protein [Ignavibacteria bacterium]
MEWESIWFYEQCLFYLNRVEFGKVKELLKEWNIDNQNYYWSTKISSILSEIGDYDRANNILNNSLQQIRATYNFDKINYKNLSQEGWIVFLLDLLNYRNYNFKRDETVERFRELSKYKCSPWDEFQDIDNILSGSLTTKNNGTKKKIILIHI